MVEDGLGICGACEHCFQVSRRVRLGLHCLGQPPKAYVSEARCLVVQEPVDSPTYKTEECSHYKKRIPAIHDERESAIREGIRYAAKCVLSMAVEVDDESFAGIAERLYEESGKAAVEWYL